MLEPFGLTSTSLPTIELLPMPSCPTGRGHARPAS